MYASVKLYVGPAQKKIERATYLRIHFDKKKQSLIEKSCGSNLYIKNLDETVDDNQLREAFTSYGTITSAKVSLCLVARSKKTEYFIVHCCNVKSKK